MLVRTQLLRAFVVVAVLGLLIWGFTDVRRRAETDPARIGFHRTDVTVYTEAGAAFFEGRDPYAVTNVRGWHYLYPPLFALLVAPLHPLPTDWQGVIWFLLSLLMAGGCLFESRLILKQLLDSEHLAQAAWADLQPWVIVGTFVALLLPFLDMLQRGQVGVAVLWPLLAGFRLMLEATGGLRLFVGGMLLALPVALKATPALPVSILLIRLLADAFRQGWPPLLWRFTRLSTGIMTGLLLFFLLIPAMAIGWTDNLRHLESWYLRVASNEQLGPDQQFNAHSVRNQGLANAVYRLGNWIEYQVGAGPDDRMADHVERAGELPMDAPIVGRAIAGARAVLVVLLLLVAVRWRPATDSLGLAAVFGLACAMTLPLSPISWGHHFVILLPAVLVLPLAVSVKGYPLAARWLAIVPAVLLVLHYLSLELAGGIAGRLGILGIGTTIWCIAVSLLLLWNPPASSILLVGPRVIPDPTPP